MRCALLLLLVSPVLAQEKWIDRLANDDYPVEAMRELVKLGPGHAAAIRYAWKRGEPLEPFMDLMAAHMWELGAEIDFVRLLGEIGPAAREAIPVLESLCGDYHTYATRSAAQKALSRIRAK